VYHNTHCSRDAELNKKCKNKQRNDLKASSQETSLETSDVAWMIILKWILDEYVVGCGTDSAGSGCGPVEGSCEHGNESWGFITRGQFFHKMSNCKLILNKRAESSPLWCDTIAGQNVTECVKYI
jgi:hypothetical protein